MLSYLSVCLYVYLWLLDMYIGVRDFLFVFYNNFFSGNTAIQKNKKVKKLYFTTRFNLFIWNCFVIAYELFILWLTLVLYEHENPSWY